MTRLRHIHHKTAKGRRYTYFDTGLRDERGRKIFKRMPSERDPAFPRAYNIACDQREKRKTEQPIRTFDGLLKLFEKSQEFKAFAANTQRSYSHYLSVASSLLRDGEGKSVSACAIEPCDIATLRDTLADGKGANQAVRSVRALFKWAKKPARKYVGSNPAEEIELLGEGEHEPWPHWLLEDALADEKTRAAVALLYFTGQRIGDVAKMLWTDIRGNAIEVRQEKTDTALSVPIHAELAAVLAELPKRGFTILTNEAGKQRTAGAIRQMLQTWAAARGAKIVPHGLRKNAVNALLEAGCSSAEVSAITGQSLKTVEHYAKKRDRAVLGKAAILKFEGARQSRNGKRT